jgi:hypothetical protein
MVSETKPSNLALKICALFLGSTILAFASTSDEDDASLSSEKPKGLVTTSSSLTTIPEKPHDDEVAQSISGPILDSAGGQTPTRVVNSSLLDLAPASVAPSSAVAGKEAYTRPTALGLSGSQTHHIPSFLRGPSGGRSESRSASDRTLRVLALHGGGVRGIMELRFLQRLEAETGRAISDMFHIIGGTSAGGLIAAALTLPAVEDGRVTRRPRYTADFTFNYLRTHYKDLFRPKWKSCGGLFGTRYCCLLYTSPSPRDH